MMGGRRHTKLSSPWGWHEGALFSLFCAAGLVLWNYGYVLGGIRLIIVSSLTAFAVGMLLARLGRTLFGPVLLYELVRTARRGRYVFLRCVYGVVLLVILWTVYVQFSATLTSAPAYWVKLAPGASRQPVYVL